MNPRRRLALKRKARARQEQLAKNVEDAVTIEESTEEIAETSPTKIIPSGDGKAETVIKETKNKTSKTAATPTEPTIKTKTARTTKAKKATPAPKTRKTKSTKKTS